MQDIEARLDRVESALAIQQLPIRYAMAVDGRDIDSWVNLFVADVNCGSYGCGRDALRNFIEPMLTNFYRSSISSAGIASSLRMRIMQRARYIAGRSTRTRAIGW